MESSVPHTHNEVKSTSLSGTSRTARPLYFLDRSAPCPGPCRCLWLFHCLLDTDALQLIYHFPTTEPFSFSRTTTHLSKIQPPSNDYHSSPYIQHHHLHSISIDTKRYQTIPTMYTWAHPFPGNIPPYQPVSYSPAPNDPRLRGDNDTHGGAPFPPSGPSRSDRGHGQTGSRYSNFGE
jgi:hypothetical protein